jgi:DNA-binding MurR/RpiR family transcriptional regulator
MKNLYDRLQAQGGALTESESVVAEQLLRQPDVAAFESLRTFAQRAGVNPSTLSRLVAKLGYERYRDLQIELRETAAVLTPSPSARAKSTSEAQQSNSLESVLDTELQQVQQLRNLVKSSAFADAVKLITNTKGNVRIVGYGWSRSLADLMGHRLSLCRPRVQSSSQIDTLSLGELAESGPADCLVAIATRRYSRRTVEIAHAMAKRGVPVIAITDSTASPLLRSSSIFLIVSTMRADMFDSPTPIAALVHLLCIGVMRSGKGRALQRIETVDILSDELGMFSTR